MGSRLLARIVDGLVLAPVWITTSIVNFNSGALGVALLMLVINVVAYVVYDTVMISGRGQTVGKKALGLRVVNLANGAVPTQEAAGKRAALYGFSWFAFYIGGILVALSPLFDGSGRKQGWHDKVGGTVVIKV
ncbi:MAG: RDD family protein [Sporichthyaceae bacterium]